MTNPVPMPVDAMLARRKPLRNIHAAARERVTRLNRELDEAPDHVMSALRIA